MAQLAEVVDYVSLREIEKRENELAAHFPSPPSSITRDVQSLITPFVQWCDATGVRACPARPTTVAAYLQTKLDEGIPPERILRTLSGIAAAHNAFGFADPTHTTVVANVLEGVTTVEPPRSWPKAEKLSFNLLPPDIRAIIAKREQEREITLR